MTGLTTSNAGATAKLGSSRPAARAAELATAAVEVVLPLPAAFEAALLPPAATAVLVVVAAVPFPAVEAACQQTRKHCQPPEHAPLLALNMPSWHPVVHRQHTQPLQATIGSLAEHPAVA